VAHGKHLPGSDFRIQSVEVTPSGQEIVWLDNPAYPGQKDFKVTREQAAAGPWENPSGVSLNRMFQQEWARIAAMSRVTAVSTVTQTVVKVQPTRDPNRHTSGVIDLPNTLPPGAKQTNFVNLPHNDDTYGCKKHKAAVNHLFFYHPTWYASDTELRESFLFYIDTPWKLSYPSRLQRNLESKGFKMVDAPDSCERWMSFDDITNGGVNRGHMEIKVPIGYLSEKWFIYNEVFNEVEEVLENTFPDMEITLIVLGSVAIFALLAAGVRAVCLKMGWNTKIRNFCTRKVNVGKADDDCVELHSSNKTCNCGGDGLPI
jgi:hypothetical protein